MKRWPVVRHIRYYWHLWQFYRWWVVVGHQHWLHPNQADFDYLDMIWEGKR